LAACPRPCTNGCAGTKSTPACVRGVTSEERDRIKALEREVKDLRKTNEILKLANAFFA